LTWYLAFNTAMAAEAGYELPRYNEKGRAPEAFPGLLTARAELEDVRDE
jgi:hypothetical protein